MMPRVNRGPLHLLLLIALVLQCSPLCTCNLVELLSGHLPALEAVAHARGLGAGQSDRVVHTCETPSGQEECSGLCSVQKSTETKKSALPAGTDLAPFAYSYGATPTPAPPFLVRSADARHGIPDGPNPPLRTPLLI
jgi:hypothetical protein